MTAKRATPDNLLFLDSDAVNSSPMEQDELTRAPDNQTVDSFSSMPDQQTNPAPESSGLMPVPCQDSSMRMHGQTEGENESSLVLTQPMDNTGMTDMTINHKHDEKTDNSAVMENEDIPNSNPDLINIQDSGMERNQNDKKTDLNHKDDPNAYVLSPEGSLLKEKMSQDTFIHQYALVNTVSDIIKSDQSTDEPFSIASNDTDKTTCESPEGVDEKTAATCKTYPEMHDIANDVTSGSFTTSKPLKIEDLKTDISVCLPTTGPLNILAPASTLLETLGILETADVPVNETEMDQSVNSSPVFDFSTTVLSQMVQNVVKVLEHDKKESESSKMNTILDKYATSECVGQEVSQNANDDDDALVNSVSDVINTKKSPDQPFSIANNELDAASSEPTIQTCRDTPESLHEMHDKAKDVTCGSFTMPDPLKIEDLKTEVSVCLAGMPETGPLNILAPASTVSETLGKNNIFETANVPINDSEMIVTVNKVLATPNDDFFTTVLTQKVQNVVQVSDHDRIESKSNRMDTILDEYAASKSAGDEKSQDANDDNDLINTVSDVINTEKSPDQPFAIANNESDAASFESTIQTYRDTPECVVALEEVTTHRNLHEMHDTAKDRTCGSFTMSDPLKKEDLKTEVSVCLAGLPETGPLNILAPASTVLETLGKNNILETADVPINESEMILAVNKDFASPNDEISTTVLTQMFQNVVQVSDHDKTELKSNRMDTILDEYAASKSAGDEISQEANDDNDLINTVSDVINTEKSPVQPFSIANNESDAASSESTIQTYRDTSESVVALEVVTTYRNLQEFHDTAKDNTGESFDTSDPQKIEDLKTDVAICLAGLPETDPLNISAPAFTVLETLGKNKILETADMPVNETQMILAVNKDLATPNVEFSTMIQRDSDHDVKESESNKMDAILDKYTSSESVGPETRQVANNDDAPINTVSDEINSEKSHDQQFSTANSETDKTSSEFLTQTCQDEPECVIIAEEGYDTLPEMRDIADDLTCGLLTTLKTLTTDDLKTDIPVCLADALNILTPASTLLDTLRENNNSSQISDMPMSECEMIQTVTVEAVTTHKTHPVMHDIAEDLTCCDFITSEIPKVEEPKTSLPLSLADLHKADTPNILTHASTLLDSLGMNNNFSEAADVSVNNSEIIHTVNKDLASSSVEFYTSIITQSDPNILQDSELDVVEAEPNILIDMLEVSKVKPLLACSNDPRATVIFSQSIQETPQTSRNNEKDSPVRNEDLGNCFKEIDNAYSEFTVTERDVKGDSELLLDPCQFLAGEEDEGAIFDKRGHSCSLSPPTTHPDNTKASDYSSRENISIEDWELRCPPVERWSSSDSWASALSDWFQSVNTYQEDSITDSKLSMAIQDNILEQRTSSDNSNNAGQTCLSLNLLEPDKPNQALGRGLVESDNTDGTLFKQEDKDRLPSHSDSDRLDSTRTESQVNLLETLAESESHKPDKNTMMDTFNAVSAYEFDAKLYGSQHISGELWSAKPEGKVTEDKVSQLGLVFGEERQSNFPSPRSLAYTREKNLTGYVNDEERRQSSDVHLCICPPPSDSHVSSNVGRAEGNESFVHSNIADCSVKPRGEDNTPQFIMPFAPICTGNTFICHSFLKEERSQPDLDLLPKRIINKSDQKSSSGDDSSEDHFHTCPDQPLSSSSEDSDDPFIKGSDTCNISKKLSNLLLVTGEHFMVSEDSRVAYVTLDLDNSRNCGHFPLSNCEEQSKADNMPHKTSKTTSEGKMRSKHKEKPEHQNGIQASKKQDLQVTNEGAACEDCPVTVIETIVITEKIIPKTQGKKKKKHAQHGIAKPENHTSTDVRSEGGQKNSNGNAENLEAKVASNGLNKPSSPSSAKMEKKESTQKVISVKPKVEPSVAKMNSASVKATQKATTIKLKVDTSNTAKTEDKTCTSDSLSTCLPSMLNDDIKRRRIAVDLSGAAPIRTRPQLPAIFRQTRKDGEDVTRRAYSEVVKQSSTPKEVVVPRVVSEIQADPVPADPQNILLWCQFSPVPPDATIKWSKEGTMLSEINKVEREDGRFTLTITKACSKDLGLYKCSLNAANISVSTSEYHLTSEVLMELVIPSHDQTAEPRVMDGDEENIQCSPLIFKEDFLSDQYFGENQPASILTEKVHFGEGMHRKAFRTTLTEGKLPRFRPGHPCVLKVHNAITYGTKNNEELVQKNYSLAVEECHVQNTAREYIKAYNSVAKTAESFGEVPEIIPIYLVHRPSNNIPYATLEEELLGDFVKYSVKDGKEINLMRRDSEAGQKCCAFQHWVYTQTEGNLLVTDMQGVGMKLTDVGIATCKKGYKGFRGNCATTFIDQFKALHQCNRYCELLNLTSLQPKPKRAVAPPKPKTQPVPKKKTFGPVLNAKS